MNTIDWGSFGAFFGSAYIKRWLEGRYDQFFEMPAMAKLQAMDPKAKLTVEALLYGISAFVDQKWNPQSPWAQGFRDVISDAAPEICSRLLNDAKTDLSNAATAATAPAEVKSLAQKLLGLEDATLLSILLTMESADEAACSRLRQFISSASPDELLRFSLWPAEQRGNILKLDDPRGGPSMATGFMDFIKSAWEVLQGWGRKGAGVAKASILTYARGFAWLIKVCAIMWGLAVIVWLTHALAGSGGLLSVGLGLLTACCAVMGFLGHRFSKSWLFYGGVIAVVPMAVLLLLACASRGELVPGLAFLFYLGIPSVAVAVMALPLTTVLEILRSIMPSAYEGLAGLLRAVFIGFFGILICTAFLLLFPVRNNPAAIFLLGPLAIALTVAVGIGVVSIRPERFFGVPFKIGLGVLVLIGIFGLSMPNLVSRLGRLPGSIDRHLIVAPTQLTFASSKEIIFVNSKDGTALIWFAERPDGGFDLYHCDETGGFTPDGRKLQPADSQSMRTRITAWVDEQARLVKEEAARNQKQEHARAMELAREVDAKRAEMVQIEQDKAVKARAEAMLVQKNKEEARRKQVLGEVPRGDKVTIIVAAASEHGHALVDFSLAIANQLRHTGKNISTSVLGTAFVDNRMMEAYETGQPGDDLRILRLGDIGEKLLLIRQVSLEQRDNKIAAGTRSAVVSFRCTLVNAVDGKILEAWAMKSTGVGLNDTDAYRMACEHAIEELQKKSL